MRPAVRWSPTTRFPDAPSNCLRVFPETPSAWANPAEAERWAKIQAVTSVVTGALEVERREKRMGAALGGARLFEHRVSVAQRSLLVKTALTDCDPCVLAY